MSMSVSIHLPLNTCNRCHPTTSTAIIRHLKSVNRYAMVLSFDEREVTIFGTKEEMMGIETMISQATFDAFAPAQDDHLQNGELVQPIPDAHYTI